MASTTEIIEAAKSLAGCKPQESTTMVNFFSDADNVQAIAEAYDKFGGYPAKNRASYHTGVGFLGTWHDFCDFAPVYEFYCYAKISADFPKIAPNKSNCYKIKSALVGLETVKANAMLNDAVYQKAIETKISEYNALYASLSCDEYIINQEKIQAEEASLRTQENAAKLQAEAFDKASGTTPTQGSKTGTYILYGFVGVSAIIFISVMLKKD
jgi:hypothetical protein